MPSVRPTSPLSVLACVVIGAAAGLLLQVARSSRGLAPFVPPYSLPITLVVIGLLVLAFGVVLHRAVTRETGGNFDAQSALVILAAARASQFGGALLGGFAGGLALSLLTRSVAAPLGTWLPMVIALIAGLLLLACGVITEYLCRIPPRDDDGESDEERGVEGAPA